MKAKKLDILLTPGGLGASPLAASDGLKEFAKWGAENEETVLTGGGSVGLVEGKSRKQIRAV